MARALTTVFRPYSLIASEVEKCRSLGDLGTSIDFSITDFILGPLAYRFRNRLTVELAPSSSIEGPASVDVSKFEKTINLQVAREIWYAAARKDADSRRILAHEIGHIWLHKDDKFSFSEYEETRLQFMQSEYYVEDQANVFADIFLLPDKAVRGFDKLDNLIDYCDYCCGVPIDVIRRRFSIIQDKKRFEFGPRYELGRLCQKCGGEKVHAVHSYRKCDDCGYIAY